MAKLTPEAMIEKLNVISDQLNFVEFLKVSIANEQFLLPLKDIEEVMYPVTTTPVPMAPAHFIGLANIHGEVVCIVDPCKIMGLKNKLQEDSESTRLLRTRNPKMKLAIKIDAVSEVVSIQEQEAEKLNPEKDSFMQGSLVVDGNKIPVIHTQSFYA